MERHSTFATPGRRRTGCLQARRPGIVFAAGLGIVIGCGGGATGGSNGPGNCQVTNPCGGDLTGAWTATGVCMHRDYLTSLLMLMYGQSCPAGAAITLGDASVTETGSITFAADGSWSENVTAFANLAFQVPASCLSGSCTDFGVPFQPAGGGCSGSDVCACTVPEDLSRDASVYSGTYVISGTSVQLTFNAGTTISQEYCVQGNELRLIARDVAAGGDEIFRR